MHKHRGFPSRLPGTDFQFTIRRPNKSGPTEIIRRERYADRRNVDRKADEVFLQTLIEQFGAEPFVRGNLDAGRLSWLIGREVVALGDPFDPQDYESLMQVDISKSMVSFPNIFAEDRT
ncbi:hypothetical protein GCM10007939_09130 [Amylibacter marinus]|uniref:Uncharacterized protein n=1 Tax=Amylibacter marinus TaxID=1475483 RepID=A0ABQ5VTN2_9RHOB|nr:hypothetical protein [Amylibacter marinus]GLQ34630.1 hypothetical protein GCM10007939_09130 [Amylibacter marinus]